jgi:hypothetical protein
MCVTTKQFDKALGPDARILRLAAIVRRPKPLFWKPKIQEKPYGIGGADLVSMDYGHAKRSPSVTYGPTVRTRIG